MRSRRKPQRAPFHDYCGAGTYHIIISTRSRRHVFGYVRGGCYHRTPLGSEVEEQWSNLGDLFEFVHPDVCVAMPDHFHGLLRVTKHDQGVHLNHIIKRFKGRTSHLATHYGVTWSLWQRHYWDVLIQHEAQHRSTRRYIELNPQRWIARTR